MAFDVNALVCLPLTRQIQKILKPCHFLPLSLMPGPTLTASPWDLPRGNSCEGPLQDENRPVSYNSKRSGYIFASIFLVLKAPISSSHII